MTMTRCYAYERHVRGTFLIEEVSLDRRHPRTNFFRKFLFHKRRAFERGPFLSAKKDVEEGNEIERTNCFRSISHIDFQNRKNAKFACRFYNDGRNLDLINETICCDISNEADDDVAYFIQSR